MKKIFLLLGVVFVMVSCNPKLIEKVESTYSDGQPQLVRYYDKHDNCVKEAEFYESGQIKMEGEMKDDHREGEWKAYFPDGRVQSLGFFKDGLRTGAATVWQANGNLLHEGFYKNGRHCGKWKYYDEQGDLIKEVDYGE